MSERIEIEQAPKLAGSVSAPPQQPLRWRIHLGQKISSAIVWLVVAFNLVLVALVLLSSFKTTTEVFQSPLRLPAVWRFGNWADAWSGSGFGRAALNTVVLVVLTSIAIVLISAPAAYALARSGARGSRSMTTFFVLGMGIPPQVIVIPLFLELASLHLVNSLTGLGLVYLGSSLPFTVYLLTGFFRSLPDELEEAAMLDGAGAVRTFLKVMLPLARSGLVTALMLNAVGLWNEVLMAIVFIQSDSKFTLSLALMALLSRIQYSGADYGLLFAGISIMILPMLLLFLWLRRQVIEGMTLGMGR